MLARAVLFFSAQALFIQVAFSSCGCGCGCGFTPAASTGGSFVVTSSSPIAPVGVSVLSENCYEGALAIEGNLPLLGSVALEGALGTAGAGAVSYGCGDGAVGIVAEEGPIITGIAEPIAIAGPAIGAVGPAIGVPGPAIGYPGAIGAYGLAPYGLGYGFPGLYGLGYGLGYGAGYGYGLGYGGCGCGYGIY